jgi:hypothetical protein
MQAVLAATLVAALPALAQAKDALSIDGVKVETKTVTTGKNKGNDYLRVSFTATANEGVSPKMYIRVKAKATVDDRTKSDDIMALGKLDALAPGESKDMSAPLFMTEGLGGPASRAELTFMLVKIAEKSGPTLAEFCWSVGSKVKAGACE